MAGEMGMTPVKWGASDAIGGQSIQEDGVRNYVNGCTQTKENENDE